MGEHRHDLHPRVIGISVVLFAGVLAIAWYFSDAQFGVRFDGIFQASEPPLSEEERMALVNQLSKSIEAEQPMSLEEKFTLMRALQSADAKEASLGSEEKFETLRTLNRK